MHSTTFDYLKPTEKQIEDMTLLREAARVYAEKLTIVLPDGPDKTYAMRKLREVAMWVNVSVTRQPDGSPRPSLPSSQD